MFASNLPRSVLQYNLKYFQLHMEVLTKIRSANPNINKAMLTK